MECELVALDTSFDVEWLENLITSLPTVCSLVSPILIYCDLRVKLRLRS